MFTKIASGLPSHAQHLQIFSLLSVISFHLKFSILKSLFVLICMFYSNRKESLRM